ncbi:ABC-three component system protein [Bradyrhizobium sp. SZCCHNR1075]|uniref:ABC-three component system protein n=1 Tax=Bradyrhizobium sp. SZCCHNR1075 TaxID=3057362 RepID=UPI0028E3B472|nr:ABC-three component system protein [Bradyrhizobium sp. SZCCHNR1075]
MNIPLKASKYSAPGQYLGYALQPLRLCYHLLQCPPGAFVSMEYSEDVAVHYPNGTHLFEQDKSALKQNPIADWSDDLWKTLAHWLEGIKAGDIDPSITTFRIYVTPAHEGEIATALSAACTLEEVQAVTAQIRTKLSKRRKPPSCDAALKYFLDASDQERFALVHHLDVHSSDEDPLKALQSALALAVPEKLMERVCRYLLGNAKERVDRLIREGKPAVVSGDEFKRNFHSFMQSNNLPGYLKSMSPPPEAGDVGAVISTRPTFIRQLELIEARDDQFVRAASDFLRTSADKVLWAEAGDIFEGEFDDWDENLVRRHAFIRDEISETEAGAGPEVRGRLAYFRCAAVQASLSGREVPGHFVHGSFNFLADNLRLGWHPNYEELLGDQGD